jgi:hypothetical protein
VDNAELRCRRTGRIVQAWFNLMLGHTAEGRRQLFTRLRKVAVAGTLAVCAPVAFVSPYGRVAFGSRVAV